MPWWPIVLGVYVVASVISAILLAIDKRAARLNRRRIPEARLHLVELLGGWPGSLIARKLLRHKTRKLRYRVTFWLIAAVHLAAWIGWTVWRLRQP